MQRTNSKRPADTPFTQQRLKTRPSNVSTFQLAVVIFIIGIIFTPVGTLLLSLSNDIYEQTVSYDKGSSSACSISESNEGTTCQVEFPIDTTVSGPLFLYYQLENYFQNHRRYYQSKSINQLAGQNLKSGDVSLNCNPLYMNGTILLNPCGLIANSFFNDQFVLDSTASLPAGLSMDETNIALPSDKDTLYKQVEGFQSFEVANTAVPCSFVGLPEGCRSYYDPATGQSYLFQYPDDDTVQYLYESYPNQISPIDGVTDQHFIVWMRPESLPTFRKLYGVIDGDFVAGDKLVVNVTANFEVDSFGGRKSLVISNLGRMGSQNPFPGQVFVTIGSFCLIFGAALLAKEFYL